MRFRGTPINLNAVYTRLISGLRAGTHPWRERRLHQELLGKWLTGKRADLRDLYTTWLENAVEVRCPVVLISQVRRSVGTLISQLFDGHPECHAHPPEWHIAYSRKRVWPQLDLKEDPEKWFKILFEPQVSRWFREGYCKKIAWKEVERFPFLFLPSLQREIFLRFATRTKVTSQRDVFDAYMGSFFNAWLDNQNRYGPKKIVTAFATWLAMREENIERFFDVYPDGKLLSIVRDPQTWYVSVRQQRNRRWENLEYALGMWKESAQSMLKYKERYRDRVCILRFEDLLSRTEATMRFLARYLGIHFDNVLQTPTFNKMPIRAHSSFAVDRHGVVLDPLSRHELLTNMERDAINRLALGTYEQVVPHALRVERQSPSGK